MSENQPNDAHPASGHRSPVSAGGIEPGRCLTIHTIHNAGRSRCWRRYNTAPVVIGGPPWINASSCTRAGPKHTLHLFLLHRLRLGGRASRERGLACLDRPFAAGIVEPDLMARASPDAYRPDGWVPKRHCSKSAAKRASPLLAIARPPAAAVVVAISLILAINAGDTEVRHVVATARQRAPSSFRAIA